MTEATDPVGVVCAGPTGVAERVADSLTAVRDGIDATPVTTAGAALAALDDADALVTCDSLDEGDGLGLLRDVRTRDLALPVILAARDGDESLAAAAVDADVTAYVPWDGDEVPATDIAERVASATASDEAASGGPPPFAAEIGRTGAVSTLVLNRDGDCVWANERARERLGIETGGAFEVGDADAYDADGEWLPPAERPYVQVFETGEPVYGEEIQFDLPEGRRWVAIHARPIREGDAVTHVVVSAVDVTERRERERELAAEKERFRRLVNALEDYAIFRLDADGRVASWNAGAGNIKGYAADEILGEHFSTFYTESDREAGVPERNLEAAREHGRTEDEGWRVRADGSKFRAKVVITALRDEDGELVGYSKVTQDVTERYAYERRLERERTELTSELNEVLDRVSDAFLALDDDWTFTYVNEQAADLIEIDPEEALGESIWDLFPEAVGTTFETKYRHAMSEQEAVAFEEYYAPLDRWFEVSAYPSETGISVYFRDVTERRQRQRQYETLVENFPNGAVVLFDESLTYRVFGGTVPESIEGPPERLEGRRVSDVLPGEIADALVPQYRAAIEGERNSFIVEFDGEVRRFHTIPVRDETGNVIAGMAMSQNVTERRERHEELLTRATEQATVADLGRRALDADALDTLLEEAVAAVTETLRADLGAVFGLDDATGEFCLRTGVGWDGVETGTILAGVADSPVGHAARSDDPVVVEDLHREARYAVPDLFADHGVRSGVNVLVGTPEEPWGVLSVFATDPREFSETDVAFLRSVAALIAAAVDRRERERDLERYETLTETTTDGVFMTDGEGRLLIVNDAFASLVGRDREALVGTHIADVMGESIVARARTVESHSTGEEANRLEFELDGPDGERTPIEASFSSLSDERGAVGVLRDVTERKRFERRLRSLHDSSRRLFEATTEAAVSNHIVDALTEVLDLAGVIVYRHEGGELIPAAQSAAADFVPDALPALPVDDSVAGRVFKSGDSELFTAIHEDPDCYVAAADSKMAGAVVVPLGGEGVVVVGSRERDAFDESTRQLVEIVAANATAAYNRVSRERELRDQRQRLAALDDLNSLAQSIAEAVVRQSDRDGIEGLVCERLAGSDSYEFAWIGEPDAADGTVALRQEAGVEGYLDDLTLRLDGEGPTARALATREMQVVQNVDENEAYEEWRDHAAEYGYRSSVAIPILFQDTLYGVLNVYSARRGGFGDAERETLNRLGTIVGHAIRSVERERRLRESEQRYRTLAENFPNGWVMLVGTDERYRTVAGTAFDYIDVDPEAMEGDHVTRAPREADSIREQMVAAFRAALGGRESRMEIEYEERIYDVQTIPIREDGTVTGAMALAVEVTERKRREEELEAERARLEFLNRLIRHNLLNSLNVVDARLELLDGEVPEAVAGHLDTARARTTEMIDLVETIRSLMSSVVGDEDDLEPVDVDRVLAEEVEIAARSYEEAEFDLQTAGGATVLADDLLEEVFENLLANAVQHNDKETPRVRVETAVGDDVVRVRVADNGPGVPAELQDEIFGKGTKSFDSPGTGFGLHLSREIVNTYDGDISVGDATEGGAVFTVTLPRA
ncbi:MAG: PAS domain-containing protein [Halobacteriaceae archaeon]